MTKTIALASAAAMLVGVSACGSGSSGSAGADEVVELNVWAWETSLTPVIAQFEKENPNIKINLQNVGTNTTAYTALDNAIQAGSGAPDVAQIEYYALPQYAIQGNLLDITDQAAHYADFFTDGTWSSVQWQDRTIALPMDSGPMAFFYNYEVFEAAGVDAESIKTWDDYYEAAKKIRANGSYITSDTGDNGYFSSMVWLAGGTPYSTSADGENVSLTLDTDSKTQAYIEFCQKMIDEDLIDTKTSGWSEEWFKSMTDGSIASLLTGAWMPANLANSAPAGAGKWRITQMPTMDGEVANSENGGSSLAILSSTKKADAAYKFIEYANAGPGVTTRLEAGSFPADKESLANETFLSATTVKNSDGEDVEYFGGQEFNRALAEAASRVSTGYEFLPFEIYARNRFGDFVGKSFTSGQSLKDGVVSFQNDLVSYGTTQGFNMN